MQENENMILQTSSPYAELKVIAYNNDDDVNNYDFDLVSFQTDYLVALGSQQSYEGYDGLEVFDDDEAFLNEKALIVQKYTIKIKKAQPSKHNLSISLGANKTLTKIVANIKKNEDARYYDGLKQDIIDDINKKLIKAKILLGVRSKLDSAVQTLVNKIKVNGYLNEDVTMVIATGIEPKDNTNGVLRLIYKEKKLANQDDKNQKIDYSNRGFVCAVRQGEQILEYIKPKKGSDGKNLRGEYLKAAAASSKEEQVVKIYEDEIELQDQEQKIIYTAKKSGYILQDHDGKYGIKDNLELLKVDFRSTGSINAGVDKNVKLNVKESDSLKDAIGPNVNVEIEQITVEGSIAQDATIKAKKAIIKGQTHSKSKIYANECQIAVHKGFCSGDRVIIDKLENGEVHGKTVIINQALGGKVYAQNVYVKILNVNSTFYITQKAHIKHCNGQNNKFIINPSQSVDHKDQTSQLLANIASLSKELDTLVAPIRVKKSLIESNKASIIKIKAKIEELRMRNAEPPEVFFNKLKDFQELINSYNELVKQQKIQQKKLSDNQSALEQMQEKIFDAKVENLGTWKELNEIKFVLTYPKKEFVYSTKEDEMAKCISLKKDLAASASNEAGELEEPDDIVIDIDNELEIDDYFAANEAPSIQME